MFLSKIVYLSCETHTLAELWMAAMNPQFHAKFLGYLLYLQIYNERDLRKKHFKILDYNTIDFKTK